MNNLLQIVTKMFCSPGVWFFRKGIEKKRALPYNIGSRILRPRGAEKEWIITKKGPWLVVLSYLIWGALPIFWKLLQGVMPLYLLASRILWSMVFLGIVILLTGRTGQLKDTLRDKKEMGKLLIAGIVITIN